MKADCFKNVDKMLEIGTMLAGLFVPDVKNSAAPGKANYWCSHAKFYSHPGGLLSVFNTDNCHKTLRRNSQNSSFGCKQWRIEARLQPVVQLRTMAQWTGGFLQLPLTQVCWKVLF